MKEPIGSRGVQVASRIANRRVRSRDSVASGSCVNLREALTGHFLGKKREMNLAIVIVFSILTLFAVVMAFAMLWAFRLQSTGKQVFTWLLAIFMIATPATLIYVGVVLE